MFKKAREPVNSLTHFIGAVMAIIGTIIGLIVIMSQGDYNSYQVFGLLVFGISMFLLYGTSSLYHCVNTTPKALRVFRRLDHSMIFVLIAGSYTPIYLNSLEYPKNIYMTIAVWVAAIINITVKMLWFDIPRWVTSIMYIAMGWFILVDPTIFLRLQPGAIALLLTGGVCYTAGGLVYAFKKPDWFAKFGFHEFFHILVMFGSFFHFLCVILYICR